MKFLFLLTLLLLPPVPLAHADANEEYFATANEDYPATANEDKFTVKVEHYEIASDAAFNAREYRGREWDLRNLLAAARFPSGMEWIRTANERPGQAEGRTYCVRISAPRPGARTLAIAPEQRELTRLNLLDQLKLRKSEMVAAGAYYRVESPSRCARERPVRQVVQGNRRSGIPR